MRTATRALYAAAFILAGTAAPRAHGQAQGPTIAHEPITVAARGQAMSILARVRAGNAAIKTVTLYYTPSRDSSPIAQPMTPTGGEVYVGTIPTTHLATAPSVHYYIEAVDMRDEWAETPWSEVRIRDPRAPEGPAAGQRPPTIPARPVEGSQPPTRERRLSTGQMIAGGALAAGAAVAIIAATDGGGGGGGGGTDTGGDDGGGSDTNATVTCSMNDVLGTWSGTTAAPGFILYADGSADFFATVDGDPGGGTYGLANCTLTLIPATNEVYRGSGDLSPDKTAVTINGVTFTKL